MNNTKKFCTEAAIVVVILILLGLLIGVLVMLLWNWLMPTIFGLPTITYWQAWGLWVLCHLLFKSSVTDTSKKNK